MAGPDSSAGAVEKTPYMQQAVEEDLRCLYRAEAFVELVRHYHESTHLHEVLQNRYTGPLHARDALPKGAWWPGEISPKCITEALHSVFCDIATVRKSLNTTLHPHR